GMRGDEKIQRLERRLDVALRLVSARKLIEDEIALRIAWVAFEQLPVERDAVLEPGGGILRGGDLGRLDLEVREAPHRFRAQQRIVRGELEEAAIALDRLLLAGRDRGAHVDLDDALLERLDRNRLVAAIAAERP